MSEGCRRECSEGAGAAPLRGSEGGGGATDQRRPEERDSSGRWGSCDRITRRDPAAVTPLRRTGCRRSCSEGARAAPRRGPLWMRRARTSDDRTGGARPGRGVRATKSWARVRPLVLCESGGHAGSRSSGGVAVRTGDALGVMESGAVRFVRPNRERRPAARARLSRGRCRSCSERARARRSAGRGGGRGQQGQRRPEGRTRAGRWSSCPEGAEDVSRETWTAADTPKATARAVAFETSCRQTQRQVRPAAPRSAISLAASRYDSAPLLLGSYVMTVSPKLGASDTRTDRGTVVRSTSDGKCSRTSSAT